MGGRSARTGAASFWKVRIDPVRVAIEQSAWVRDVLPGLGYDRYRLIELSFPPPLPDHPNATAEWDKALRAFAHRYGDCVSEFRDLLRMWEKQLGAAKDHPVATVIAKKRGWEEEDERRKLLDGIWKRAGVFVNAFHHPEGQSRPQPCAAADARFVLLLIAALLEYLAD